MTRSERVAQLDGSFDVLVIGGGATGLGVAVDAATRGYRTALVEAGDFAQATSSRATKLVHGGVRYLASGQIHLVYEALHERAVMLRNAPHLVKAQAFVTPAYHWWELPYYGAGLKLYDVISGRSSMGPTRLLGRKEMQARLPGIAAENLKGGILYHDGQFDDARLALALGRTAEDAGAVVLNYVRAKGLTKQDGKVLGATVQDLETGLEVTVRAKAVINATGIFVDEVRRQDDPARARLLSVSRGTHIVVGPEVLGGADAIMVPKTEDGRIIFAIPWLGKVVIGTTDLAAPSVEMEPGHEASEIAFLLETINPYLRVKITEADILSVFSGLRPLVTGDSKTTSKLSREHHIDASPSGLVTVAGGKWTTYRRMAEDTLDFAIKQGLLPEKSCVTGRVRLHGAPAIETIAEGELARFGTDADAVRALAAKDPALAERLDPALPFTFAEVVYAVRAEMARTVEDVLSRRTRALLLDAAAARRAAPAVARLMAKELGAPEGWAAEQAEAFDRVARTFYVAGVGGRCRVGGRCGGRRALSEHPVPRRTWARRESSRERRSDPGEPEEEAHQHGTEERAEDRDGGIAPVGRAFAGDGQKGVGDAWAEITRGVDGIAGGAAEREADAPDQHGDEVRREAGCGAGGGEELGADGADDKQQDHGGDDLAEEIGEGLADCGCCAEDRELELLVVGDAEVRQVEEPDERCAGDGAEHLRAEERHDVAVVSGADGDGDGDGGVEVGAGAAARGRGEHAAEHGEGPAGSDDDPAGIF